MRGSKRSRLVYEERLSEDVTRPYASGGQETSADWLEAEVAFLSGGMSFSTYKQEPRGFYLHVSWGGRLETTYADGRRSRATSYALFASGTKNLIEQAPRFNEKRLAALAESWRALAVKLAYGAPVEDQDVETFMRMKARALELREESKARTGAREVPS